MPTEFCGMKKFVFNKILAGTGLLFLLAVPAGCSMRFSEQELEPGAGFNFGFEKWSKNLPVNWIMYTGRTTGEGQFSVKRDQQVKREGESSLFFDVQSCSAKGGHFSPGFCQEFHVKPGVTYLLRCQLMSAQAKTRLSVSAVDATSQSALNEINPAATGNEWQPIVLSCQVPENMNRIRIEFNVLSAGQVHVDQLELMPPPLP